MTLSAENDSATRPKTLSLAILLLGLSAIYSVVVEIWSAPILFAESRGFVFVVVLVAGIVVFYMFYGWLIYHSWQGVNVARFSLIALIVVGISIHTLLALSPVGELFGPISITIFLDSLRVVAAVLLIASPRTYWKPTSGD
jgi:hypothetical protein